MKSKVNKDNELDYAKEYKRLLKEHNKLLKKFDKQEEVLKITQDQLKKVTHGRKIARHKFGEKIVKASVNLYANTSCGLRDVEKIFGIFNEVFDLGITETPCKSTLENWLQKAGLNSLKTEAKSKEKEYALVQDELMVIGHQRMLGSIYIPANKSTKEPLKISDVRVADLTVLESWNTEDIKKKLSK